MMINDHKLIYVHDPMCSWCWAFRPVLSRLIENLPRNVRLLRLLGGLAPDNDQPMAQDMRAYLEDTWRRIQQRVPGTGFNFDFWTTCSPRRSTWPACRAVIAARHLQADKESAMIEAIQQAYYLEARNPSEQKTLVALASEIGLDPISFGETLEAPNTDQMLKDEITEARRLGAVSFPSLRLVAADAAWPISIDYRDVRPMLDTIESILAS